MSDLPPADKLNAEQADALERAAYNIINARNEGTALLMRSGVEPVPEQGWWGNPCGALLPAPPQNHRCGCRNYTGDGGPCRTRFTDFTGPGFPDSPAPTATCRHRPSQHLET